MYYSIKHVSPTIVASTPMWEPIIASFLAWFLFKELVGGTIIIGGSITFIGLFILTKQK